jgi:hypothetical protein
MKTHVDHVNMYTLIAKRVHPSILDQINANHDEIPCCDLCLYGLMYNAMEYMWNGVNLLVFDESDGEYHEFHGTTYIPNNVWMIQFEFDETTHKWVAMPSNAMRKAKGG